MAKTIVSVAIAVVVGMTWGAVASGDTVVCLDAVPGGDPTMAAPPWTVRGTVMKPQDGYLLQDWTGDDPKTSYGYYLSTRMAGVMRYDSGEYGVEFRVQPLTDMPTAGSSQHANLHVAWGDDKHSYAICIDRDADDGGPGVSGALRYGRNSMKLAVEGIDWSEPHTIFIGYRSAEEAFRFYVDGKEKVQIAAKEMGRDHDLRSQDILSFGDSTLGQPEPYSIDVAARWYFVAVHDSAVPPADRTGRTEGADMTPKPRFGPLEGIGLYGGALENEEETAAFIKKCRASSIGYLIPSISGGGTAYWQTTHIGMAATMKERLARGYDGLACLIKHAHAAGIEVYPSVAICPGGSIIQEHPEWETRDRYGRPSSETTAGALAMSYPEARRVKIAALMDLVNGYEIDGILLDYCRYPENTKTPEQSYGFYGYDPPILDACLKIHGFDPRTETINSPRWNVFNELRSASIVAFVRELCDAIETSGKQIRMLGFGSGKPDADGRSCARSSLVWAREGLIDDYIMGIYPDPITEMKDIVAAVRALMPAHVGVYSSLSPFQNFLKTPEEMVQASQEQLAGGASGIWVYRHDFLEKLDLWESLNTVNALQQ